LARYSSEVDPMKPQRSKGVRPFTTCCASLFGLFTALFVAAPAQALTRAECLALATIAVPDTAITSVRVIQASGALPENCRVTGTTEAEIRFEVRLPTTAWNGKLYHQGGSGFDGQIPPRRHASNAATPPSLRTPAMWAQTCWTRRGRSIGPTAS
jgi:hypothetical protein